MHKGFSVLIALLFIATTVSVAVAAPSETVNNMNAGSAGDGFLTRVSANATVQVGSSYIWTNTWRYFSSGNPVPYADVTLQSSYQYGAWTNISSGTTDANGTVSWTITPEVAGFFRYREVINEVIGASILSLTVINRVPVSLVPGGVGIPTDTNDDGLYDDVNGNGRQDFADVVLYFNQMSWIGLNEPITAFDYNGNSRIDFGDVVWLFNNL